MNTILDPRRREAARLAELNRLGAVRPEADRVLQEFVDDVREVLDLLRLSGFPSLSMQQSCHMSYKTRHEDCIEASHDVVAHVSRPAA